MTVYWLQEAFRYGMYLLLRRTEAGLKEISENHEICSNKLEMAYVSGLGFGIMSGAFALVNVLADSVSHLIACHLTVIQMHPSLCSMSM